MLDENLKLKLLKVCCRITVASYAKRRLFNCKGTFNTSHGAHRRLLIVCGEVNNAWPEENAAVALRAVASEL